MLSTGHIWGVELNFAGDDEAWIFTPVSIPQADSPYGIYIKTIDIYYQVYSTLPGIRYFGLAKSTMPANGAAHAATETDA